MIRISLSILCLIFSTPSLALQPGDELPAFELEDQHGNAQQLDNSVQRIYTSGDRKSDKLLKAALEDKKQAALDRQNAIVVADISAAPSFVRRIIRSNLKDRDYITWLDQRGKSRKWMGYKEDRVGIIELDKRIVTAVRYLSNENELTTALEEETAIELDSGEPTPESSPIVDESESKAEPEPTSQTP